MCRKSVLTIVAVVMAILVLTTAPVNAGVISYVQITNDADSGISADNTYTHTLDFGTGSPGALINGVQFDAYNFAANGTLNFNREVSSGDLSDHAGNGNHNVSGGLVNLLTDMYYNGNNAAGGTTTWTLSGLTAGQTYATRIYTRQWGPDENRNVTFVFDPDGAGPIADSTGKISQDNATSVGFANGNDAYYINYQFKAVAGEDLVITATQDNLNYSWHLYGLSNQEAAGSNVASHPNPANRSTIYVNTVSLTWEPGDAAVSHDIYFSDNPDDVNAATSSDPMGPNDVYKARQSGTKYPPGLWDTITVTWGKTYYWRIDEVNDVNTWRGDIWSFEVVSSLNYDPTPNDGAKFVPVTTALSWGKGALALKGHIIYFGTDFATVNNVAPGTESGPAYLPPTPPETVTSLTRTVPGDLLYNTTYYWRADAVEQIPPLPLIVHKGDVWSFTTLPFIPISDDPNLVGWWTFDEGEGRTALDWSGHGNDGTLMGDPEYVAGHMDNAMDFDGGGDYVNIGYSPELSLNEFTVSAWVNIAAEPGTFGVLGTRVGGDTTFDFKVQASNIHGDIGDGTAWINTAIDIGSGDTGTNGQGGDLAVDTWYMITYVIDNTNQQVRLYLDGDLKRTIDISGIPLLMKSGQSMRIGDTGCSEWMNGQLDDVRLYNKALSTAELRLIGGFFEAYDPLPADEASGVSATPTLDWLAGVLAASHDVYFGTVYADVKAGTGNTFKGNQPLADTDYVPPAALTAGKVYYWKITEVNDLHPDRKWEGPVWVFRVAGGAGGLLGSYYHHTGGASPAGFETFVLSRIDPEINFGWGDTSPDPLVNVNQFSCRWQGQVEAPFSEDYTFYTLVDDGERLWIDGQLVIDQWIQGATPEYVSAPIPLVAGQKYDIVMEQYENEGGAGAQLRWSSPSTSKRIIPPIWLWPPTKATNRVPPDGSTGAPSQQPTLSWMAGVYAAAVNGHRVYFDADELKVIARAGCQVNNVSTTNPSYALPYTFGLEETYYWAVDEVNGVNSWPGDVWSFTTSNNLVVDDMETYTAYNVADNNIFEVWVDGAGNCGSVTGNNSGAILEVDTTYYLGGVKSMKYQYDNDGEVSNPCPGQENPITRLTYSKAEALVAQLPSGIGSDWTLGGVAKVLSLWFYGDQYNSIEPMWVQLTDVSNNKATVFYGAYADEDVNDMNEASWHEWLIDLADFTDINGVDVSKVKSMAIGVGNEAGPAGGSGTLYFDDIRLYTTRCVLTRRSADFARVDYVQDCVVDYKELEVMAENWLHEVFSYYEDFDSYAAGSALHGQGGWKGWDNDPAWGAPASNAQANSGSISAEIGGDADLVHEFDFAGGILEFSAMQYIPDGGTGQSFFILLNQYNDGGPCDWSVQLNCDMDAGQIVSDMGGDASVPIKRGEWVQLKFVIDLDKNTVSEYYDGALLSAHVWDDTANGTLQAIDLFGNGASSIYFDDIMLDSLTDLSGDDKTNFKDFAELAVWWLDEQLWP